jgi:hypothetical protein
VTSPITIIIHSQISNKRIEYNHVCPDTLLALLKGSKSKAALKLADRLIPVVEDLTHSEASS